MFFNGVIQRKLTSLLRQWLAQEPELEVKLGFFRSVIVAKNLKFDVSAINDLIEGGGGEFSLLFRSVTVDEVIIRVAHWSAPAFTVEVSGVNVTLFLQKRVIKRVEQSVDDYLKERKKKILAEIDHTGSTLHDNIENVMMTATSKSKLKDSITNLLLMHCCLHLHDALIRVEYPVSDDTFSWLCYSSDLNAQSSHKDLGCLLGGFISLFFLPLRETSIILEASKLEIGAEKKDHSSCILSCVNPYFGIGMKDLCLVNSLLSVPELNLSFSPTQLQMMCAFNNLLTIECKHVRSGRLLWGIARWKFRHSLPPPGCIFYSVVLIAVLWLRLVKEYLYFLLLVGYSEHGVQMPNGGSFPRLAEQQWKIISQIIEKELPAEAIASARRVARFRAALKDSHAEDTVVACMSGRHNSFWIIILPLAFIWDSMVKILGITVSVFRLHKKLPKTGQLSMTSEVADPRYCFHLSLGKILAMVSFEEPSYPPAHQNSKLRKVTSYTEASPFILLIKRFLFIYEESISEQNISFTLGFLEVTSTSVFHESENKTKPKNAGGIFRGQLKERLDGSETIVRGEPALTCCHSEEGKTGHEDIPILEQMSGEMELIWKRMQLIFEECKGDYDKNPWAFCTIHTFLVYPGKSPDSGFSKCNLMAGKLNITLGYASILSFDILRKQLQHALHQDDGFESVVIPLHSLRISEESQENQCFGGLKYSLKAMNAGILKLLPDKHLEVSAVIAGPRFQLSMRDEDLSSSDSQPNATHVGKGVNLTIDVHKIEFSIWPTVKSGVVPSEEHQRPDNFESEFLKLEEHVLEGFSGSFNIKYASKGQITHFSLLRLGGLSLYFEDLMDNHQMQVLVLKPLTVKLSSLRDHLYSFAKSNIASSLSLHGAMSGVTGSLYMDELSVILQVVERLFSAESTSSLGCSGLHAVQNNLLMFENQSPPTELISERMQIGDNKEAASTFESVYCFIKASFELFPFDIILHNCRNGIDRRHISMLIDANSIQNLGLADLSDCGIWLSIQKTCLEASVGEAKAKANASFHELQAIMFSYKSQTGKADNSNKSEVKNAVIHSADCMHEVSLSSCTFNLLLESVNGSGVRREAGSEASTSNPKGVLSSLLNIDNLDSKQIHDEGSESNVSASMPSYMLVINITVEKVFIAACSIKNGIFRAHPEDKLYLSLSVGGDFQSIVFGIQGGHIFIETKVLAGFARCVTSYLQFIRKLIKHYLQRKSSGTAEGGSNDLAEEHIEDSAQTRSSFVKLELLKAYSIKVSQLSLVLLVTDETRVVKEFIGRVDLNLKLWSENLKKKFLFNISHLDILSLILDEGVGKSVKNIQMPHFSSVGLSRDSSWFNHEDSTVLVPDGEETSLLSKDASFSSALASMKSSIANDSASQVIQSSETYGNHILERLATSISAEKPISGDNSGPNCSTQGWIGKGYVTGLNLTISLSEIQMLLTTVESLSEISGNGATTDVEERSWTASHQEPEIDLEAALPDGAIVAIQDVHQHLYVTVENMENKYKLGGAVHYSLAGKRALFRVKWQKRSMWKFSTSWFSLMSLYAKSDSGVPLRLNYLQSSGFVDISSNDDSACSLWKIAPCKHENYEDDADLEPLNHMCKNTFYLVNKKNDCGAAFVHGAIEFVKKPGNPFKFKIFNGLPVVPDLRMTETCPHEAHGLALLDGQDISEEAGMAPCISLTIEKISLIIVHELSDPRDKLPLLQGSIDGTELVFQILPQKTRVMSTLTAMLYYFDVYRVIWREFVQPIEMCIYWRLTTPSDVTEISNHAMLSRLYFRMQELDLSLTEVLLDMLLYVVGKLDLAGPFAVRNSAILVNCCKVENQLDLDLLFHFHNNQSARVGRRQSAFISLRHLEEPPESSYATILLENPGISSTTSVHVPLSGTQIFAWRTRITSQDSRTCPGPFIVFDVSKNAEEGLSLNVSPLLRIHNNTGFPVELRIQRPESMEAESASVVLKEGDTIDDCMAAFDAISLSGGPKKALLSLGVGNFVFSFRPEMKEENGLWKSYTAEWSENLKGEKAVRLSGVIDKLSYQVRKAFSAESWKYSFSIASCLVRSRDTHLAQMHFLVQRIARNVPIMQPNGRRQSKTSSIALQEQKEIFLLPTVTVSNLLETEIDVLLTETETAIDGLKNINRATIQSRSTANLFANPAVIFFNITLAMFSCSCKPVNCSQWLKKLNKKNDGIQFLDIDLEFCGGTFFACLRLARGNRGVLEAIVFTQYTLRNDTDFLLFCAAPHLKPLSRDDAERHAITTPPQFGTLLPPKSPRSWFMKSSKLCMELLNEELSKSILDLDALSGFAEIRFTKLQGSGIKYLVKLGISLGPLKSTLDVPARMVSVVPRYIISNESDDQIFVRQCFLEDDFGETLSINSKQKTAFFFTVKSRDKQDISFFNKLLQKHKVSDDDTSVFVQFSPNEAVWGWSGPVCVASLGCFFLKFRGHAASSVHQLDLVPNEDGITWEYAAVHVVEEGPTFVLHFYRPPDTGLPYRIENNLHDASITYYQKDTFQPETLASGACVSYVWDDLTRPHKLMVKVNGTHMIREISLDKLRSWKSFFRAQRQSDLVSHLTGDTRSSDRRRTNPAQMDGTDVGNVGYEVYVDGPTRVLRISHSPGRRKADNKYQSCKKIQLRISYFAIHLLEPCKEDQLEDVDPYDLSNYTPIIIGRLENISIDSIIIDQRKYNQIRVQSMHLDEKWVGAPFAAMLRRHLTSNNVTDDPVLFIAFVLFPTTSSIRDVKYSSIILQPIDLNLDEETLMKVVPFWRTSLSSNTQSQQYYFDHFEIHPIKITTSFLPEDSYSNYSSGQEALRSLLHSVIKIPAIKNLEVELNGIFVTHALVTTRELLLRCAQHYSWYGMRAIYIAKGSPLLPPAFASVFDDLASSSLDVFFDPSSNLFNVRGLTVGTFKLIKKCIEDKGFYGTKRYFGDLSKTLRNAGSNILFAAVTEVSDSVLKGAESSGFNGMVTGFHHGILRLAMEPSLLGTAFLEGGPDRRIKLDRSPGIDELYVEGYLQAMLDTIYKQDYLRVRVIDDQVILKNLPPNSSLIDEIMERVKDFLASKSLLKGNFSTRSRPLRHLRGENEWKIGPTVLTLCEHLFVSFAIRMLRKQTDQAMGKLKLKRKWVSRKESESSTGDISTSKEPKGKFIWRWGIGKFVLSALVAYIDGRLCRCIPNPVARRIVSGFLLSFLDSTNNSK
ncbi:uncharacterized protein LOC110723347 isoform X1 [Chenopodium quinoa]|uniref:uncharacterized protein LOC110723347 isoform X1 n=1 Tax=Chenopodium quinoa TaxID=63459 RepID=UPI000B784EF2|nr:uncharacterized protein LOC110723347 isoform X1 [Chenopodium quinoa]